MNHIPQKGWPGLRSNFPEGSTKWAVRRAQWRALGIEPDDMTKPKIAVVNSSSTLSSCYSHLDDLSRHVQESIRGAGGLAFEIRTVAPSDFVTSAGRDARYLMPSRDLIVNDIEVMVEGALLDGMVCLSSCDKTTPAHLMAACRLNIPTILVIGGYQDWGSCGGLAIDIDDVYESVGALATATMSLKQLTARTDCAISSAGVCSGLGTANTMHIMAEALGMALPGSAPIRATGTRMRELAAQAGIQILDLVRDNLKPRDIVTAAALCNAVTVCVGVGGSVNAVRHLSAVATEAELNLDVIACFEQAGREVPLVAAIRPNGPHRISDLEAAGGARAVMTQLRQYLDTTVTTVTSRPLGDQLNAGHIDETVIRPCADPISIRGGLAILRGTIAPGGAIVKTAGVAIPEGVFAGPALVFDSEADAIAGLGDGRVMEGTVVILRGLGPRGGPGTVFAAGFASALVGAGLADKVALVTDGELSGLNRGIVVGQVMPEAADGGPLAYIDNDDRIVINLAEGALDVDVDAEELTRRRNSRAIHLAPAPRGWLSIYRALVQPIEVGATLVENTSEDHD
jgi:dihydroxy-acid dehydratase